MKVHEIINIELNEGLLAKAAAKILGRPLDALLSAVGKGSAGRLIKSMASHVDDTGKLNIAKVEATFGKEAADNIAKDPALIGKIEKYAISARSAAAYSENMEEAGKAVKSAFNLALGAVGVFQYCIPLDLYLSNIEIATRRLADGRWSRADFDEFNKREIGALIGKWTALVVGGKIIKIPGGIIKALPFGVGSKLAPLVDGLTPAVQTALSVWLSTDENARYIATALARPLVVGGPSSDIIAGTMYYKIHEVISKLIRDEDQAQYRMGLT